MNVVLVAPFGLAPKGTVSRRMLPLASALARGSPYRVTAVVPSWDHSTEAGRVWMDGGARVVHVPLHGGAPGTLAALLRTTLAQQPAVVHGFKPKGYSGLVLWFMWQARRLGLWHGRLVIDTDDWETGWNTRLAYPAPLAAFFAWQETWCLRQADGVTAASRWLVRLATELRGSSRHVRHVPNGLNVGQPAGSPTFVPPHPPTALLYTRFVEVTPQRVHRTWLRVRQLLPTARLIVAGDSLTGGQAAELAARAGPSSGLHCLGWAPAAALPGVLAAADVAWAPSATTPLARARCSVKLLELMHAGLPVVADAEGEVLTYVRQGVEGILVRPDDDQATAQALVSLLTDRPRAAAYGQHAATRVRREFTWDRLAPPVARFYQELSQ